MPLGMLFTVQLATTLRFSTLLPGGMLELPFRHTVKQHTSYTVSTKLIDNRLSPSLRTVHQEAGNQRHYRTTAAIATCPSDNWRHGFYNPLRIEIISLFISLHFVRVTELLYWCEFDLCILWCLDHSVAEIVLTSNRKLQKATARTS